VVGPVWGQWGGQWGASNIAPRTLEVVPDRCPSQTTIAVLSTVPGITRPRKEFVRLVLHGDEDEPPQPSTMIDGDTLRRAKVAEAEAALRERCQEDIYHMFSEYAPHRLGEVKELVARFRGREEVLVQALKAQYRVTDELNREALLKDPELMMERSRGKSCRERLVKFFEKYHPSLVDSVDDVVAKWAGREDDMWIMLEKAYGPADLVQRNVSMEEGRSLLIAFYESRLPQMVQQVDFIIREYGGNYNLIDAALRKKYGSGFL